MNLDCPRKFGIEDGIYDIEDWRKTAELQCKYIREVIQDSDILISNQSTEEKWSSHLIVKNYYTEDNNGNKSFYRAYKRVR